MSDNRQFSQLSGRTNEVERPVMPDTGEEREIIDDERDAVRDEVGVAAGGDPEGPADAYTGDDASEDYGDEVERERQGR